MGFPGTLEHDTEHQKMCNGSQTCKEEQLSTPLNSNGPLQGREPGHKFNKTRTVKILAAAIPFTLLFSALIATAAVLAARTAGPCLDYADVPSCPDGWVGYQGQCYFFSEEERNWTASQSYCSSHGASLAGIDGTQEMAFLLRYKGSVYHWIGLRREPSQPWRWPNGTEFDSRFEIRGGGDCAYLNDSGVSTSSCATETKWVCVRSDWHRNQKENRLARMELNK
ncbi:C-type lectin domain family 2 member D-like isoform X1 [Pelodiscus sinensis]|uniref:C-type lectin domain family 2 member D-like isoform X1 n=2 Tax=Pelodiscus sinensis TaxID=13735 RepID=UPI003F6C3556